MHLLCLFLGFPYFVMPYLKDVFLKCVCLYFMEIELIFLYINFTSRDLVKLVIICL